MKLFHKYHLPFQVFTFVVTALLIITVFLPMVRAVGEYQASDLLGHLPVTYVPTFTQSTAQSNLPTTSPTTNRFGLFSPTATTLDPVNHLLYVSDIDNNRILVYQLDSNNRQLNLYATYVLGQTNMVSSTPSTSQNGMDSPRGVAIDTIHHRLFVVEYDNNRVLVFDTSSGLTNGMNASYVIGQPDFFSASQGAGQTGLTTPRGIAYDPNHEVLYVSDTGNHRVMIFDARDPGSPDTTMCGYVSNGIANGMNASCVIGQPDFATTTFGTAINKLFFPRGVSFSSVQGGTYELLYVADTNNNRIMVFDMKMGFTNGMDATLLMGQNDWNANGASTTQNGLSSPRSAEAYGDNYIIVADYGNNRVTVYRRTDLFGLGSYPPAAFVLGQGTLDNYTSATASTTRKTFSSPFYITADASKGNVFITDYGNNRILEWQFSDLSGSTAVSPDMNYVYGQVTLSSYGPPDYTASGQNNSQSYLSPDPYANEVGFGFRYQNDGDAVVDTARNKLYVSDANNNRVLVYNLDANKNLIDRIPDAVLGQSDFYTMSAGQGANGLSGPRCLTLDESRGYLFVCDTANLRVLVYDVSSGVSNNMNASFVLGQVSLAATENADTTPTADRIGTPVSIAYDPSSPTKDLYLIDGTNSRLLSFDTTSISSGMSAAHILNANSFGYSTTANANDPYRGLAIDTARHYLYTGRWDGATNADVAVYDITSGPANNLTPLKTSGLFSGDIQGLSYSSTSKSLFVSNSSSNRVLVFDFQTITQGENADGVLGQNDFTSTSAGTSQGQLGQPADSGFDDVNRRLYQTDSYNSRVMIYNFITLQSTILPGGLVGTPYVAGFSATNYQAPTIGLELVSGALPPGITISNDTIGGTPTTVGTYTFTLRALDTRGGNTFYSNEQTFTIDILPAAPLPYLATELIGQVDTDNSTPLFTNATSGTTSTTLSLPTRIALDDVHHRLFVADSSNFRITEYDLDSSNNLSDKQADHVIGAPDLTSLPTGSPSNSTFGTDSTGLYGGLGPIDIVYDAVNNRLFATDTNRVLIFDLSSGIVDGMPATHILGGQSDYNTNSTLPIGQNTATFTALAYDDATGLLYASDTATSRVLVFDVAPAGSRSITRCGVTTNGLVDNMNASCVLLQPDYADHGVAHVIEGLALDQSRGLLFASTQGGSFLTFDVRPTGSPTQNVCGVPTSGIALGDSSLCTWANTPSWGGYQFLSFDQTKKQLFYGDYARYFIYDVSDISIAPPATPRGVLGQLDFTSIAPLDTSPNQASISSWSLVPAIGSDFDEANNRLYIADTGLNRVMIFNFVEITNTSFPGGVVGTAYSQSLTNTNAQGTVSYAVTSGTLPPGVTISGATLSGTPTTAGTYTFNLQATDTFATVSNFISNEKSFTIVISDAVGPTDMCDNIAGVQATIPSGYVQNGTSCDPVGGGGPSWCQDTTAINYGGSPPCVYANPDLCPNIPGQQSTVPSGMVVDINGNCVTPSGSSDICPNINGVQIIVPAGYYVDLSGNCVENTPADICPNIPGQQSTVPSGMVIDSTNGNCVIPVTPTDLCANIAGVQSSIPSGMVVDSFNNCYTPSSTSDICPNIPGQQSTVPSGLIINSNGDCVSPSSSTDLCPNISGTQSTIPSGMVVDINGNCIAPVSSSDLCPNIAGDQATIPSGLILQGGICVLPPEDLCTINPSACITPPVLTCADTGTCPVTVIPPSATSTPPLATGIGTTLGLITGGLVVAAKRLARGKIVMPKVGKSWSLFLIAFGIKRRERPWGTVYDSITKKPLDPVKIELIDQEGKVVSTAVTDHEGRYGFLVPPGMYAIRPHKDGYIFPSLILGHLTRDEVYLDLYFGKYFEIKKEGEVIAKNIPMDPIQVDKKAQTENEHRILSFFSKRNIVLIRIADALFVIGLIVAIVAVILTPIVYNFIILILYALMLVLKFKGITQAQLGYINDSQTGSPVANAILHVFSATLGNEVVQKVTDNQGRFYCLVPNGQYYITIETKNTTGNYVQIYESLPLSVKKGIIRGKWKI